MSIRCAAPTWLGELIYQKKTSMQAWPQNIIDLLLAADQALPRLRATRTRYCNRLKLRPLPPNTAPLCRPGRRKTCQSQRNQDNEGGPGSQAPSTCCADCLSEHEVLRYMRDLCVPFSNNLAERAIRMALGLAEDFGLLSYLCGC